MKTLFAASIAAFALPGALLAQDLTIDTGFAITSEAMSEGFELSRGGAVQPYIELGLNGFYAGLWATNLDSATQGADSEVDVYLGYSNQVGRLFYDVGLAYYTYQKDAGAVNDTVEYLLTFGYTFTDTFSAKLDFGHTPENEQTDAKLTLDFETAIEGLTFAATYGDSSGNLGDWNFWTIGGAYAISDNVSFDLTWHDATSDVPLGLTDGKLVATMNFAFSLR